MDLYDIEIQEFPDEYLFVIGINSDSVIFLECNHARKITDTRNSIVAARLDEMAARVAVPEHLLTQLNYDDAALRQLNKCRFLAQCQRPGKSNQNDLVELLDVFVHGNLVAAVGQRNKQSVLFTEFVDTGQLKVNALSSKLFRTNFDGSQIYGFRWEPTKAFFCFDLDLNELWKHELCFQGSLFRREDAPQFFQDLVIFNGSVEPIQEGEFAITAFAKADGRVVWTRVLEQEPYRTLLVGDKLYLALDFNMLVLDATTGKTLVNEPTGFARSEYFGKKSYPMTVFPVADSLFVFGGEIRVFTQDGKSLIQEIKLPRPQSARAFNKFYPHTGRTPLLHGEHVYCTLEQYVGLGAIGILTPTPAGEEPKITIKPRIPYDFSEVPDEQGGYGYRLHYSHDNLDDLVSAARYELMEICQYCGIDRSEHKHFDPLFNGRVIVAVDSMKLPPDAKDELEKMAKVVEIFLETFLVRVPFQPFKPKPGETTAKKRESEKAPDYPRNQFKIEIELY